MPTIIINLTINAGFSIFYGRSHQSLKKTVNGRPHCRETNVVKLAGRMFKHLAQNITLKPAIWKSVGLNLQVVVLSPCL
jgi:hypothetical protein